MSRYTPRVLTFLAFCIALNIVGSNLALFLRLPLYLDTFGTLLAAIFFGPLSAVLVGASTGVIVGLSTDIFSLYYLPVQLIVALIAGLIFKHKIPDTPFQILISALLISVPGTIISTMITFFLFHGITSSGSSLLVQIIAGFGLNKALAIFLVQVGTDYLDRLITLYVIILCYRALNKRLAFRK